MIATIDTWIGKHLFVPPIIRICQWGGVSQYRFYRYAWLVAAIALVCTGPRQLGWFGFFINVLLVVVRVASAALTPDRPTEPSAGFRRTALVLFTLVAVADLILRDFEGPNIIFWLAALAAEYALTIRTIPPREVKERKRKLVQARAGR